jgi:hypothetical protein
MLAGFLSEDFPHARNLGQVEDDPLPDDLHPCAELYAPHTETLVTALL